MRRVARLAEARKTLAASRFGAEALTASEHSTNHPLIEWQMWELRLRHYPVLPTEESTALLLGGGLLILGLRLRARRAAVHPA